MKAPLRVDLGMGGISDLPWWCNKYKGVSVSLCLDIHGKGIVLELSRAEKNRAHFIDVSNGPSFACSLGDLYHRQCLKEAPKNVLVLVASTYCALEEAQKRGRTTKLIENKLYGIRINNFTKRHKGLGTSSILSATVILGLFRWLELEASLNELVKLVIKTESILGSGGGWEDPAGVFFGGVTLVISKPQRQKKIIRIKF